VIECRRPIAKSIAIKQFNVEVRNEAAGLHRQKEQEGRRFMETEKGLEDADTVVEWEGEYRHGAIQVQAQTDRRRYRLDAGKCGLGGRWSGCLAEKSNNGTPKQVALKHLCNYGSRFQPPRK
jgi:hypothetical protein